MNFKFLKLASISFLGIGIIFSSNANEAKASDQVNYSLEEVNDFYLKNLNENSDTEDLVKSLKIAEESDEVMSLPDDKKIKLIDNILEAAPEEIVKEYQKEKIGEINTILSNAITNDTEDGATITEELEDGSTIVLGSTDEPESVSGSAVSGSAVSGSISTLSTHFGPYQALTKEYGNRRYTAWVKLKTLGVTMATMKLVNHYSVGDYGLKMRSADIAGTNGTWLSTIDASAEVLDDKAEKVGYDINARGTYKLTGKLNNGYVSITSYIILDRLVKKEKYARVYQKYAFED